MVQWLLIKQVQASCENDLGPRSRNDHDLQYLHSCIKSISFRLQAAIVSEKSTFSLFPITKFELGVKYVKVNPGSSFVQTIIGRSSRCYILSFIEIGLLVLEKKIFEGFLPYMGLAAILVM